MDKQVCNMNFLEREVSLFKSARSNVEKIETEINNVIETHTIKEKQELERAIDNYNGKVKNILESEQIKSKTKQLEEYSQVMSNSIKKAFDAYQKALVVIDNNQSLTPQKKIEYKQTLYRKIIERFLEEHEINMFNNLVNMMGGDNRVIMIGN